MIVIIGLCLVLQDVAMHDASAATLLLVDDEPIIAMNEKVVLEKYGYRVITAYSGEEAVQTVDAHPEIDLILMDIDLGKGMDGTEAAAIILKQHDLPLVFLSSHTDPATVDKTEKITSFGYITKMSGETVLIASIKMAFRLFESQKMGKVKEADLEQNQYFLYKAQELGKIGHFSFNPESGVVEGSPELFRIFGVDEAQPVFKSFADAVHPDDHHLIFPFIDRAVLDGVPYDVEHRVLHKDGTVLQVHARGEMARTPLGRRMIGTVQDITESKAAQAEMMRSRERFRQLIENAPYGIVLLDLDAFITDINQKQLDYMGKKKEDLVGKNFAHILSGYGLNLNEMLDRFKKRVTGELNKFEYNFYNTNGSLIIAEAQTVPIIENGQVTGVMYIINDITEKRQAEEKLARSRELLAETERIGKIGGWAFDLETKERSWTEEALRIIELDCDAAELIVRSGLDFLAPEYRPAADEAVNRALATGEPFEQEWEVITAKGNRRWVHVAAKVYQEQGKIKRISGSFQDITERKRTEQALKKSEEKFLKIFRTSPESISIVSLADGRYLDVNDNFLKRSGFNREEVIGRSSSDLNFWLSDKDRQQYINELFKNGSFSNYEVKFRMKNGEVLDYIISSEVVVLDDEQCVLNFMMNITERKKAEEELRKSEEKFSKIFRASPESISINTLNEGRYVDANDNFLKKSGYRREEIIGRTTIDLNMWPDDEDRQRFIIELKEKGFLRDYEARLRMKDGVIRDYLISSEIIELDGEKCILNLSTNITEQKKAEQTLRKSEEKFSKVFKASPESMSIASMKDGRYIEVNDVFLRNTGYSREEVIGRTPSDIHIWVSIDDFKRYLDELSISGNLPGFETQFRMCNGEVQDAIISSEIIELEGEKCSLNFVINITERKRAEEQVKILLAEKELLLKEINHRVKNNMNTISSLLSLQRDSLTEPSAVNALDDAKSRIDSIRALHDRLYKDDSYNEIPVLNYLPSLVDDIIANFPHGSQVTVKKMIDDFIIEAKRLQPLGIITNELLTNIMKYAFPDIKKGRITVSLKRKGSEAVLTVRDNGIGIPESVSFEHSTGFGLMLVNILTQQLKGTIEIKRGKGTAFVLTFPL